MSFRIRVRRLAFQRVRASGLHCCVPLCTVSSRYNKKVSFHSFPVDAAVRAERKRRIRRDEFNPTKNTRVSSLHFKQTDVDVTASLLYVEWVQRVSGNDVRGPIVPPPGQTRTWRWRPKWLQIMTTVLSLKRERGRVIWPNRTKLYVARLGSFNSSWNFSIFASVLG